MESRKAKDSVQAELDDLLIVFGDLEDQVAKQKVNCYLCGRQGCFLCTANIWS